MVVRLLSPFLLVGLFFVSMAPQTRPSLRVLIFLETECPICQKTTGRVQALANQYAETVAFEAVYPAETVTRREVSAFERTYNFRLTHRLDPTHQLVRRYAITTTPEVILLSGAGQILYRGSVDNQFYKLGRYRPSPTAFYLKDAIDAVLSGQPVPTARITPVGCLINQ